MLVCFGGKECESSATEAAFSLPPLLLTKSTNPYLLLLFSACLLLSLSLYLPACRTTHTNKLLLAGYSYNFAHWKTHTIFCIYPKGFGILLLGPAFRRAQIFIDCCVLVQLFEAAGDLFFDLLLEFSELISSFVNFFASIFT